MLKRFVWYTSAISVKQHLIYWDAIYTLYQGIVAAGTIFNKMFN